MISLSLYLFWLILISLRCKKILTYDKKTITIIYSNFFLLFSPLRMKKLMYWNLTIWQRERGLGSRHSNKLREVKILVQHVLVMKIVTLLNKIYARERCFSSSYECERKKKFWVPIRNRSSDLVLWCSTTEPPKLYGELSPLRSSYMIRVLHTARISRAQNLLSSLFLCTKDMLWEPWISGNSSWCKGGSHCINSLPQKNKDTEYLILSFGLPDKYLSFSFFWFDVFS